MVRWSVLVVLLVFTLTLGADRTTKSRDRLPRGDTVPFMLVVEHAEGSRCAGALVSLRSAVTTASCARLRIGPLVVLAGPFLTGQSTFKDGARRISSVVIPNGFIRDESFVGAVNDVALLRLEKPFGNSKLVRPILIEKDHVEKEGRLCSLVRAMATPVMRLRRGRREENPEEQPDESFTITSPPRNLGFTSFNELLYSEDQDNHFMTIPLVNDSTVNILDVELNLLSHTTIQDLINGNKLTTPGVTSNYISENTNENVSTILENTVNISTTVEAATTRNIFTKAETQNISFTDTPIVVPETTIKSEYDDLESKDIEGRNISGLHKRSLDGKDEDRAIIFRIFDVHTLSAEQCRRDNMLVDNHHWSAMSKHVMCTHGASFCQSDWGTGLVCEGKLCGVLSRVAHPTGQPIGVGCGTTHTLQSLPRWKKFLDCAHDPGACDDLPCSKYCIEIHLTDSKSSKPGLRSRNTASPTKMSVDKASQRRLNLVKLASYKDEENDRMVIEISNGKYKQKVDKKTDSEDSYSESGQDESEESETSSEDDPAKEANEKVQRKHKQSSTNFVNPTRSTKRGSSRRMDFSQSNHRQSSNLDMNEFEPYRADFKSGEYGENVIDTPAEYPENSEDEYSGRGKSTSSTTEKSSTTPMENLTPSLEKANSAAAHELVAELKARRNLEVSGAPKSIKSPVIYLSLLAIVLVFQ